MEDYTQYSDTMATTQMAEPNPMVGVVQLIVMVAVIAGMWKMFEKAGKAGWAAIIPFYNVIVMLDMIGKPWWWLLLLMFIPLVNIVIWFMVAMQLGKAFGKGGAFSFFLLFLLAPIGLLMLGFGDAKYSKPKKS